MRLQLLSDLHLESESFDPSPAPGAELLVLAGDIDTTWQGYERFKGWPVPVVVVAGNHEFDGRDIDAAQGEFRGHCEHLGFTLLERQALAFTDDRGRRVRMLGTTRWTDFLLFGPAQRARCLKVGGYFHRIMQSTRHGEAFGAEQARQEGEACRAWLAETLGQASEPGVDATLVITHFAPSLRSADPRYGAQPSTACFCNDDEALMAGVDLWVHGHVHCRHDYRVGNCRVVSNARGLDFKQEHVGHDPGHVFDV